MGKIIRAKYFRHLLPSFCFILFCANLQMLWAQRPNIILIMTDDQGWMDAGFNGNRILATPNLDHLAGMGVIFNRFYAASAVCSPTRASVLTGRNPLRMHIPYANAGHMLPEEITLPEILQQHGYRTAHFGKWHLGTLTRDVLDANRGGRPDMDEHYSLPTEHGYDQYFCTESKVPTYDPMIKPEDFEDGESLRYGWKSIEAGRPQMAYGTAYWQNGQAAKENLNGDDARIIIDRVIPFMEQCVTEKAPFFSTIWFHTPHLPVVADRQHRAQYANLPLAEQLYYGTITGLDEQIGRLWTKLEALGIADDTMIWFCSDNGPERDTPGSAGPLRARKRSLYEGGIRVPAFMLWRGKIKGGRRLNTPAVTSDYLPTVLDYLNIPYPDTRPLDGESLQSLLSGATSQRKNGIGFLIREQQAWMQDAFKLITQDQGKQFELYDLAQDSAEKEDIKTTNTDTFSRLKKDLLYWLKSIEKSQEGLDY